MSTHQTTAKRIANALLAAVLAIGLMVPTFALTSTSAYAAEITTDTDGTVNSTATAWTGSNNINVHSKQANRTYYAMQVFSGDYANGALSNIVWGASIGSNGDSIVSALKNNTTFGSGSSNAFYNVGTVSATYTAADQAQAVASVLSNYTEDDNGKELAAFADVVYANLPSGYDYVVLKGGSGTNTQGYYTWGVKKIHAGYYLVSDESAASTTATTSREMLKVTSSETVSITAKDQTSVPSATKKAVSITTDENTGETTVTELSSHQDVKIGDELTFQIKVTTPDTTGYSAYSLVANDLMGAGLTFSSISSITVTAPATTANQNPTATPMSAVDGSETGTSIPKNEYAVSYYTLKANGDADTLSDYDVEATASTAVGPARVAFDLGDVTNYTAGSTITITYKAKVNDSIRASEGKETTNKVILQYSNDPDDPDSKATSGDPGDGTRTVEIDTGGIVIYKEDSDENRLSGAGFSITGTGLNTVVYYTPTYTATLVEDGHAYDGNDYYLQNDGSYETCYTTSTNDKGEIVKTYTDPNTDGLTHATMKKENTEYTVSGTNYTKVAVGTGTHYKLTDSSNNVTYVEKASYNTTDYPTATYTVEQEYARYLRSETSSVQQSPASKDVHTVSDSNGSLIVEGLSAGSYIIKETQNPTNYQLLSYDIEVVVTYDSTAGTYSYEFYKYTNGTRGDKITDSTVGKNTVTGLASITIVNDKGGSLPATGGIGTTIFYIVGGLLVAGAVVYLVTRRRMKAAQE